MSFRSIFRLVLVIFVAILVQCEAWTPQQRRKASLIATSAAMPILQWSSAAHAMYDESAGLVPSSVTFASADAFQIPALAAYCAMALWIVPQTVKTIKTNWPDDNSNRH